MVSLPEVVVVSLRRLLLLVGDKLGKLRGIVNVQADFLLVWGSGLLVRTFWLLSHF